MYKSPNDIYACDVGELSSMKFVGLKALEKDKSFLQRKTYDWSEDNTMSPDHTGISVQRIFRI